MSEWTPIHTQQNRKAAAINVFIAVQDHTMLNKMRCP